ncbi:NepR family anti-sigma factor [Alsobacter sp. R-9]
MSEPINVDLSDDTASLQTGRPDTDLQSHIGRQLRAMYDTVVNQPVPDRFLELLNKLDEKTGGTKDKE